MQALSQAGATEPAARGRDFELTVLERTMDALVEGRGAIVSIIGEPGIGKTRLVWEVRDRYRDRVRFIEARGVSYAESFPYWPIRDLLREWLGAGASTPEARVRLKAELAHVLGKEEAEAYLPQADHRRADPRAGGSGRNPRAEPREHPIEDVRGLLRAGLQAGGGGAPLLSSSRTCTGPTRRHSS